MRNGTVLGCGLRRRICSGHLGDDLVGGLVGGDGSAGGAAEQDEAEPSGGAAGSSRDQDAAEPARASSRFSRAARVFLEQRSSRMSSSLVVRRACRGEPLEAEDESLEEGSSSGRSKKSSLT